MAQATSLTTFTLDVEQRNNACSIRSALFTSLFVSLIAAGTIVVGGLVLGGIAISSIGHLDALCTLITGSILLISAITLFSINAMQRKKEIKKNDEVSLSSQEHMDADTLKENLKAFEDMPLLTISANAVSEKTNDDLQLQSQSDVKGSESLKSERDSESIELSEGSIDFSEGPAELSEEIVELSEGQVELSEGTVEFCEGTLQKTATLKPGQIKGISPKIEQSFQWQPPFSPPEMEKLASFSTTQIVKEGRPLPYVFFVSKVGHLVLGNCSFNDPDCSEVFDSPLFLQIMQRSDDPKAQLHHFLTNMLKKYPNASACLIYRKTQTFFVGTVGSGIALHLPKTGLDKDRIVDESSHPVKIMSIPVFQAAGDIVVCGNLVDAQLFPAQIEKTVSKVLRQEEDKRKMEKIKGQAFAKKAISYPEDKREIPQKLVEELTRKISARNYNKDRPFTLAVVRLPPAWI